MPRYNDSGMKGIIIGRGRAFAPPSLQSPRIRVMINKQITEDPP